MDFKKLKQITSVVSQTLDKVTDIFNGDSCFMSAVISAAGSGARMGGISKQLLKINDKTVIEYSLEAFQNSTFFDEIIIVARQDELDIMKSIAFCGKYSKAVKVVAGGATRAESVANGFYATDKKCRYIAIHDAARPLVTSKEIDTLAKKVRQCGACACGRALSDTIKRIDNKRRVTETPDREGLVSVFTPQVFSSDIYRSALAAAQKGGFTATDDCALCERAGFTVRIYDTGNFSLKLTYPGDEKLISSIINSRLKGE
ncbi:MAG: 2-C-methyl-D-erythritol 4-phosphate cytidylyltransferase [Oscillospiraceae bacterium]|nr:2-C-methyl-D-erythritol 4-phosphate cytidylyltransferase [Oscillospiraceae bacterium]